MRHLRGEFDAGSDAIAPQFALPYMRAARARARRRVDDVVSVGAIAVAKQAPVQRVPQRIGGSGEIPDAICCRQVTELGQAAEVQHAQLHVAAESIHIGEIGVLRR